jgi:AAA family ATP:ADP antiporter
LDKLLSLFADVRAGEGLGAFLLAVNGFLLLTCYLILKTAREPLILMQGGAEVKAYSAAGQAVALLLAVPLYGWFGRKTNTLKLIVGLYLFFTLNLLAFAILGDAGVKIAVVFYIWVGIFNLFVISQFWAFANDIYTEGQGRRLFAFIGVGGSLGAVAGAEMAATLARKYHFTPYALLLTGAFLLLVAVVITLLVQSQRTRRADPAIKMEAAAPLGAKDGFQLILQDRYLLWIAVLVVLLNIVNSSGEYILDKLTISESVRMFGSTAASVAAREQFIAGFKGDYLAWTNLLALVSQLLLVSRIIRYAGIRNSLYFLPSLALLSYTTMIFAPLLAVVRTLKVLENGTEYSLQNTVRQALWLPTSREAKYKAKAAVDTFCQRFGDVLSAGVILVVKSLGLAFTTVAVISVGLTLVWLTVARQIAKEHARRTV